MRNGFDKIVDEEEEDEEKNKELWSEIVEACDGEAASVVRDAEEGDGLDAYEKLKERFQSATATKTAALFQGVLEYKQGEVKVAKHVTNWKDLLRKMQAADKDMKLTNTIVCVLFLKSLHVRMESYCTYTKMQEKMDPTKVYQGAIEFEAGLKDETDEANTNSVALWSQEPLETQMPEHWGWGGKGKGKGKGKGFGKGKGKGAGAGGKGKGGSSCSNCGNEGHYSKVCWHPCGYCQQWGHKKFHCPMDPWSAANSYHSSHHTDNKRKFETANAVKDVKKQHAKSIKRMRQRGASSGFDMKAIESGSDSD
jgi:hypothetical protein